MRNRRIVLNLTVAVLAFVVGVVSTGKRPHHHSPTTGTLSTKSQTPECPIPGDFLDIDYCDLLANTERYDRRIVRLDAIMLANHGYERQSVLQSSPSSARHRSTKIINVQMR
jgi:hypothetical protein